VAGVITLFFKRVNLLESRSGLLPDLFQLSSSTSGRPVLSVSALYTANMSDLVAYSVNSFQFEEHGYMGCGSHTMSVEQSPSRPMSPDYEMPGSPNSVQSDWSQSSASTMGYDSSSDSNAFEVPRLKSALKRTASTSHSLASPAPRKLSVHWDPCTVFETRPWIGKRRRVVSESEQEEDEEMQAPNAKRARFAEAEPQTSESQHSLSVISQRTSHLPLFPEASRVVLPSFNFSVLLTQEPCASAASTECCGTTGAPAKFVPFALAPKKRCVAAVTSSLLTPLR